MPSAMIRFSSRPTLGIVSTFAQLRTAAEARDFVARQNRLEAEKLARQDAEATARRAGLRRKTEEAAGHAKASKKTAHLTAAAIYRARAAAVTDTSGTPPAPAPRRPGICNGAGTTNTVGRMIQTGPRGGVQ